VFVDELLGLDALCGVKLDLGGGEESEEKRPALGWKKKDSEVWCVVCYQIHV